MTYIGFIKIEEDDSWYNFEYRQDRICRADHTPVTAWNLSKSENSKLMWNNIIFKEEGSQWFYKASLQYCIARSTWRRTISCCKHDALQVPSVCMTWWQTLNMWITIWITKHALCESQEVSSSWSTQYLNTLDAVSIFVDAIRNPLSSLSVPRVLPKSAHWRTQPDCHSGILLQLG